MVCEGLRSRTSLRPRSQLSFHQEINPARTITHSTQRRLANVIVGNLIVLIVVTVLDDLLHPEGLLMTLCLLQVLCTQDYS